ncbi:DUF3017 domain-containing protein [Nocardioides sp.]|uniref:DUF3017 domain-containing protein n=1 Tax=Nocardioides sp. TaxID=35761 RepID=UPI003D11D109
MAEAPEPADPVEGPPPGPHLSEFAHPEVEVVQQPRTVGRRYPSTVGGVVYLLVLGSAGAGLVLTSTGRWRVGMLWLGSALLGAAVARLLLPERQAGMLHIRRRLVDVVLLVLLGAGVLIAAASLPGP